MAAHGLIEGKVGLESIGPIAFGPDDVLFVADNQRAVVVAIDVADPSPSVETTSAFDLDDVDGELAAFLGCAASDVHIVDLAVHPRTHNVYLAVSRGGIPVLVRVDQADGTLTAVDLDAVASSETTIDDAPRVDDERLDVQLGDVPDGQPYTMPDGRTITIARRPARTSTVTDMAYVDGTLVVAGMSNEEFSSTLRRIPFPFGESGGSNSLEIFHVSHGKWETASPIRTFVPYDGGRSILASYTCTPVVQIPLSGVAPGSHVKGRTVAELGAGNQPLDMVAFTQGDDEYLLVCHSSHPTMKIACRDIDGQDELTTPQAPTGVPFETSEITGLTRLANLNGDYVLALQRDEAGGRHLRSLKTASL